MGGGLLANKQNCNFQFVAQTLNIVGTPFQLYSLVLLSFPPASPVEGINRSHLCVYVLTSERIDIRTQYPMSKGASLTENYFQKPILRNLTSVTVTIASCRFKGLITINHLGGGPNFHEQFFFAESP